MSHEPLSGESVAARPLPGYRVIYTLSDPRDGAVRYVGATSIAPVRRLAVHLTPRSLSFRSARSLWIESLLTEGLRPVIRVVETVPDCEWEETERRWIAHYGDQLTNIAKGGHGTSGARYSEEARAKISNALRGSSFSAEHRQHISAARRRKVIS